MPQGTIKKIIADRGFGFISADGLDIFFHHLSVIEVPFDDLQEGQTVSYRLEDESTARDRDKGPRAVSVKPVFE